MKWFFPGSLSGRSGHSLSVVSQFRDMDGTNCHPGLGWAIRAAQLFDLLRFKTHGHTSRALQCAPVSRSKRQACTIVASIPRQPPCSSSGTQPRGHQYCLRLCSSRQRTLRDTTARPLVRNSHRSGPLQKGRRRKIKYFVRSTSHKKERMRRRGSAAPLASRPVSFLPALPPSWPSTTFLSA